MSDMFELRRTYRFEAAHFLPNAPEGHRCRRVHGHSYTIELRVSGEIDEAAGWVIDFADIDVVAEPLRAALDHQLLNDIEGLANPTSEAVARWIWQNVKPRLEALSTVIVRETPRSACAFRG
jgi:6-pyruvoyltetrahydropterin/6-carboxytetrahydropterin synthase